MTKKHTAEQIVGKLREAELELARGRTLAEVVRKLGITDQTYYRWRKEYGGLRTDQARRMKDLERENGRLKKLVADLSLDNAILKEAAYHHATGKYGTGHTILKACLYYRGVTIPWASCLYVKKEHAAGLRVPFVKLTELAAGLIRQANLPEGSGVTVLFDAYYLCPTVVQAVRARGWHYIGVGKSNRRFQVGGQSHRLSRYGPNVLCRSGRWMTITGLKGKRSYRVAERIGHLKKLGEVKVVFSRRRGERQVVALVTDDLSRPARRVVADYLRRWSIELLIKDEKQHLGLGAYRVLRYRAVVRHLHLVDAAYACLTHLGLKAQREQGQDHAKNVLRLPPIRQLKADLQRTVWREAVNDVVKVSHERPVLRRLEKLLVA